LRHTSLVVATTVLAVLALASSSLAMRKFGIEGGYIATSESKYGSGFAYGATLMEGVGRFGFGLSMRRFANTFTAEKLGLDPRTGKTITYRFADKVSDTRLAVLATYMRSVPKKSVLLIAGVGPEIHWLIAQGEYVKGTEMTSRDSRLGLSAIVRYERLISMFGRATFTTTLAVSWMESGIEYADEYDPPAEGMTSASLTVGVAFPF
jgi:hypothetical protein